MAIARRRVAVLVGHACGGSVESPLQLVATRAKDADEEEEGSFVKLEPGPGGVARLTLTRVKKLNSLSLGMIRDLRARYAEVKGTGSRCVLLRGEGRALCAGGDVAACREGILKGTTVPADFFYEEYMLDHEIATLHEREGVLQVALWDGIVMGGGVGLSIYCPIRIATERTDFAMPETLIGLFPDVGMTWALSRLSAGEAFGMFLGLTGTRIGAADCVWAGLATHFCPSEKLPEVEAALRALGAEACGSLQAASTAIAKVCGGATADASKSVLAANAEAISRCFGDKVATAEDIVKQLEAEGSAWSKEVLATLRQRSPLSIKVSFEAVRRHRSTSLREALITEYRMSQWCMREQPDSDFCEGIRAVLVDKDRKPRWQFARLEDVPQASVEGFFAPLKPGHSRGELQI